MSCVFLNATQARELSRDTTKIYSEICGVQSAILEAINSGSYQVVVSNNTPFTAVNAVTSVEVTQGGSNYFPVTATAQATSLTGTGAVLSVTVTGSSVSAITVVNGGSNYTQANTIVVIDHPFGTGAQAQAVVENGEIVAVDVITGGVAYAAVSASATVVDAQGTGAQLEVVIDSVSGAVTDIVVLNGGSNYTNQATVIVQPAPTGSGSGAQAQPTVSVQAESATSPLYYQVLSGQVTNRVIRDQLDFVKDYFVKLGYNIRAQVNPQTQNTMQWNISW